MRETRQPGVATLGMAGGMARAVLGLAMWGGLLGLPAVVSASVGAGRSMARTMTRDLSAKVEASRALMGPREDMQTALDTAREQFNNLELEAALATLDAAVVRAQGAGMGSDAALAPLLVLRGGIIYSTSGDEARTLQAFQEAVTADYNAALPIELRSAELQNLLDRARQGAQPPQHTVAHEAPELFTGRDVIIEGVSAVPLQDGAQLTLYYRKKGSDAEFKAVYMTLYGNLGTATIAADEHGGEGLEYFFYIYDGASPPNPLGNYGTQEAPLVLEPSAGAPPPEGAGGDGGGEDGEDEGGDDGEEEPKKPKKPRGKSKLPRVFINIGAGTGFGIARGTAEQTYQQYTPGTAGAVYGPREQACAVERWFVAGGETAPDVATFSQHLIMIDQQPGVDILPAPAEELTMAYDPAYCAARHPVSTGLASAPFHIVPEVGVRIGRAFVLSLFGRLQVVTGSKVFSEDPTKDVAVSFQEDVRAAQPQGFRQKPDFTFAVGLKGKYFFGKDDRKLRFFGGGFAGYGNVRMRVDMGFSNDRNGNSVPDAGETALHGQPDANGQIIPDTCVPVWPYNAGCSPDTDPDEIEPGDADRMLANLVRANSGTSDARVDTVVVGPGFAGVLFGMHYQIVKNFAIFAEVDIGGWFPAASSVVFDLNVGPSITF